MGKSKSKENNESYQKNGKKEMHIDMKNIQCLKQ